MPAFTQYNMRIPSNAFLWRLSEMDGADFLAAVQARPALVQSELRRSLFIRSLSRAAAASDEEGDSSVTDDDAGSDFDQHLPIPRTRGSQRASPRTLRSR